MHCARSPPTRSARFWPEARSKTSSISERLSTRGIDLEQAFADAQQKDAGAEMATLAWILGEMRIGPDARLPGNTDPIALDEFRGRLVERLGKLAFERAQRK